MHQSKYYVCAYNTMRNTFLNVIQCGSGYCLGDLGKYCPRCTPIRKFTLNIINNFKKNPLTMSIFNHQILSTNHLHGCKNKQNSYRNDMFPKITQSLQPIS